MTSYSLAALAGLFVAFATPAGAQATLDSFSATRALPMPQRASLQQPLQAQTTRNAPPAGSMALVAPTGSDSCATADVISGTGTFPFNNGAATASPEGQLTNNCIQYNNIAVPSDVWFLWTAPSTGRVEIGNCGGTVDTKIGVYNGPACPSSFPATAVACIDDFTLVYLEARVFFDAVQNQQYLIQIGVSPLGGVPGADTFEIKYIPESCTHDDGSAEVVYGFNLGAGSEIAWIERFGTVGDNTIVTAISATFGASWDVTPPLVLNGQPVTAAIWDDPNDDGNPNDLVLLATVPGTVTMAHSDVFETLTLTTPVTVSGIYFLGMKTATGMAVGATPCADHDSCLMQTARSFLAVSSGVALDLNNMNAAAQPPIDLRAYSPNNIPGEWLLRGTCSPATAGVAYCFGDGSGTFCPCSPAPVPHGAPGKGCPTNNFPNGALAVATGIPSLTADSLLLTGSDMINGTMLFFQAPNQQDVAFGDGKRCATGTPTRRFKNKTVVGNTASYPGMGDNPISVAGAVTVTGPLNYQGWYRSANPTFCTPFTFNLTNGLQVTWIP